MLLVKRKRRQVKVLKPSEIPTFGTKRKRGIKTQLSVCVPEIKRRKYATSTVSSTPCLPEIIEELSSSQSKEKKSRKDDVSILHHNFLTILMEFCDSRSKYYILFYFDLETKKNYVVCNTLFRASKTGALCCSLCHQYLGCNCQGCKLAHDQCIRCRKYICRECVRKVSYNCKQECKHGDLCNRCAPMGCPECDDPMNDPFIQCRYGNTNLMRYDSPETFDAQNAILNRELEEHNHFENTLEDFDYP